MSLDKAKYPLEVNSLDRFEETIKQLKTLLPCKKFVITGSYALAAMGIVEPQEVKDLDIVLIIETAHEDEVTKILGRLCDNFPPIHGKNYPGERTFRFIYNKINVDIFLRYQDSPGELTHKGHYISTVLPLINAKKSYNRSKDWVQLKSLSRVFFKEEEFIQFVDQKSKR